MIKPASLREHLVAALPDLARDPDRLLVFIDQGTLAATFAPGLSFEYRYTLNLILTDFAGHPDAVMVPLLSWIRRHQPDLLANRDRRDQIAFQADILGNDKVDLDIKLPLTESVGVHRSNDGNFAIEHYPEPELEAAFEAERWRVYLKGVLIADFQSPPA